MRSYRFSLALLFGTGQKNADGERSNKLAALVNQELNVILIDELLDETDLWVVVKDTFAGAFCDRFESQMP